MATTESTQDIGAEEQARIERSVAGHMAYEQQLVEKASSAADTVMGVLQASFDQVEHSTPDCELQISGETGTCLCEALEPISIRKIFEDMYVAPTAELK